MGSEAIKPRRRWGRIVALIVAIAALVWIVSRPQPTGPAAGTALEGQVAQPIEREKQSFRIGTFNIHGCTGSDGRRDVDRVAECLGNLDFVALEEVHGPRFWERDNEAAQLGKRLGAAWLFAPATRDLHTTGFGNGLVSSLPIESWQRIPLTADNGRGCRNMVLVDMPWHGRTVHILLTHINRGDEIRRAQLREVIDRFLALPQPAILLGDMNSTADDPEIRRLCASPGAIDALGQKLGDKAPPHIDWIFVRGLKVLDAGLRDDGASDHPLAWSEVAD